MKDFLKIILTIVISYSTSLAQEKNEIHGVKDSIAQLSEKLSGKWLLIGYFENGQFVEIAQKTIHNSNNRDSKEIEVLTDSGFIKESYMNDTLIAITKKAKSEVIKMKFLKNGRGFYQRYPEYVLGREWQIIHTSQPVPKIIFKNGNPIIHLTFKLGESEIPFDLEGNILTLYDFGGRTKTYRKIINE